MASYMHPNLWKMLFPDEQQHVRQMQLTRPQDPRVYGNYAVNAIRTPRSDDVCTEQLLAKYQGLVYSVKETRRMIREAEQRLEGLAAGTERWRTMGELSRLRVSLEATESRVAVEAHEIKNSAEQEGVVPQKTQRELWQWYTSQ